VTGRFTTRLMFGVTAIVVVMVGAMLWSSARVIQNQGEALMVREMDSRTSLLASALVPGLVYSDPAALQEVLGLLGNDPNLVYAAVEDAAGRTVAVHGDPGAIAAASVDASADGPMARTRDIHVAGQFVGRLNIVFSTRELQSGIREMLWWNGAIGIAGLILALLALTLFSLVLTRGLRRLRIGVEALEQGDLAHRIPVVSADETGDLARTYNRLTELLAQSRGRLESEQEALARETRHLRTLLGRVDAILWEMEPVSGAFVYVAGDTSTLVGQPAESLRERSVRRSRIAEEDRPALGRAWRYVLETCEPRSVEYRFRHPHKGWIWLRDVLSADPTERNGRRVRGLTLDVSREKSREQAIQASESRYREVLSNIKEVVFRTDANGMLSFINPAWEELTGYGMGESLGRRLLEFVHPLDRAQGEALCASLGNEENETCRHEMRYVRRDGGVRWVEIYARLVRGAGDAPAEIFGTIMDITERKLAEERVERLAFYDALTGLPNRVMLGRCLVQAQALSDRNRAHGALLFIDLDHFKDINDTLGHQAGDTLLVEAGQRILGCVRESDTVARLGGDEFVVLLEGLSVDTVAAAGEVRVVAEKLIETLGRPFRLLDTERHCTPSIGATLFRGRLRGGEELLKQVDLAMYRAKAEGRNRVCFFDRAIEETAGARVQLESDLRLAMQEMDRLELHYQPQVNMAGVLTGVEALLRWHHPRRGWVSPDEFVPVAERSGLIHQMGEWVLENACAQLAAWSRVPGLSDLTVSVNLCALQLLDEGLEPMVLRALRRHGIDPARLRLELTESVFLGHSEEILRTMKTLQAHGLTFALDDFGTGYSSLGYLKRLPLSELKIDRSFVDGLPDDPHDSAIVETVITLARSLGLGLIAEGVESEAQVECLRLLGCERYQGYLFGRPEPAEVLEQRWRRAPEDDSNGGCNTGSHGA
jgi:diguanylate cyclase (GGDEF)-like protein/PAS domain S-box-containing protein